MPSKANTWRAALTGAVAGAVVAAAIVGQSALASGGSPPSKPAVNAAQAPPPPCAQAEAKIRAGQARGASAGPSPAAFFARFFAAVAQLEQAGTITASQAHVLDADIRAGSIDPQQLVSSGTLSRAQMQVVADRLGAVKRSLAPASPQNGGAASGKARKG